MSSTGQFSTSTPIGQSQYDQNTIGMFLPREEQRRNLSMFYCENPNKRKSWLHRGRRAFSPGAMNEAKRKQAEIDKARQMMLDKIQKVSKKVKASRKKGVKRPNLVIVPEKQKEKKTK